MFFALLFFCFLNYILPDNSIKNRSNLVTVVTLIGLFSTVCPLVSFHVVLLDKSHSTVLAAERLFT